MAARFFRKVGSGVQNIFNKVKADAPRILGKISNTLSEGGTILRKVENTGKDLLGNPLLEAAAGMALGPEASMAMAGGNALLSNIGEAGKVAKQASNLTDASTYKGGVNSVSQDILQRSTNVGNRASALKQNFV